MGGKVVIFSKVMLCKWGLREALRVGARKPAASTYTGAKLMEALPKGRVTFATYSPSRVRSVGWGRRGGGVGG